MIRPARTVSHAGVVRQQPVPAYRHSEGGIVVARVAENPFMGELTLPPWRAAGQPSSSISSKPLAPGRIPRKKSVNSSRTLEK